MTCGAKPNVIAPLTYTDPNQADWDETVERVKKTIRAKVLDSYRNGQQAGPAPAYKPRR